MRIILNEIKKIFNLKILIIALLGSLIIFKLYASFYIEHFPEGEPAGGISRIINELKNRYGNNLSLEEEIDFKANYVREKEAAADKYIQDHKEAQSLGTSSYKEIKEHQSEAKERSEENEIVELYYKMIFEEDSIELWDMNALIHIQERIDSQKRYVSNYEEEKKIERFNEIANREQPIITDIIVENFDEYSEGIGSIVIFAVMIFLGTMFIKDRKEKIDYLQYTSKIGRKIIDRKVVAAIISIFIITTIVVGVSMIIYFIKCGTIGFFNVDISSMFNDEYIIDITYVQFIILKIIILYIVGIVTGMMTLFISKISKSYLTILAVGVPTFATLSFLVKEVILDNILKLHKNQIVVFGCLGLLILIGIISYTRLKDRGRDILY